MYYIQLIISIIIKLIYITETCRNTYKNCSFLRCFLAKWSTALSKSIELFRCVIELDSLSSVIVVHKNGFIQRRAEEVRSASQDGNLYSCGWSSYLRTLHLSSSESLPPSKLLFMAPRSYGPTTGNWLGSPSGVVVAVDPGSGQVVSQSSTTHCQTETLRYSRLSRW